MFAGKHDYRPPPHFLMYLCGFSPHLRALSEYVILNKDLKMSTSGPDIMIETHLLSEKERNTSAVVAMLTIFVCMANRRYITWQVWLGRKMGLFRSAVALFPLTGERDRKCAKGQREDCWSVTVVHLKWIYPIRGVPDFLLVWSLLSPWTSVVLNHPENVSELWIRSQNPSSKSHLLYLEPSTENSLALFCVSL